ncbi:MAG TPA: MOSC domain-containing protein [Methylomirabilota bacterium]
MSEVGHIVQLSVSNGGVPKHAVPMAKITPLGLEGDAHHDHEHHGGPERAVCLFAMEAIRELQAEGHPLVPGALGENVTLEGLDWSAVQPGARLQLGDQVVLEITRYTTPCLNIRPAFRGGDYSLVSQKRHPGRSRVYARVIATGTLRSGDPVRLV